jgi:hypothetical protein
MNSFCVGKNINLGDGTRQYLAVAGWNFTSPDQLEAMLTAGVIEGYEVGQNRDGDTTYHVKSKSGRVDRDAFNAFQYEEDSFD